MFCNEMRRAGCGSFCAVCGRRPGRRRLRLLPFLRRHRLRRPLRGRRATGSAYGGGVPRRNHPRQSFGITPPGGPASWVT